jgi:hypothetical protein
MVVAFGLDVLRATIFFRAAGPIVLYLKCLNMLSFLRPHLSKACPLSSFHNLLLPLTPLMLAYRGIYSVPYPRSALSVTRTSLSFACTFPFSQGLRVNHHHVHSFYTVRTLLLHYCHTVATPFLHCSHTAVTLSQGLRVYHHCVGRGGTYAP